MAVSELISVVMPFRDAGETLAAALESVLEGADSGVEVLAVDDGSSDSGPARVSAWAQRDARVRLVRTRKSGLVGALRTGVELARGGLIARMDADDVSRPGRLEKQRAFLARNPQVALLGTQVSADADVGSVGEGLLRYVAWQNGLIEPEHHRRELFVESPLCHPSVMMRRCALEAVGGYREHTGPEDYELWLRFDAAGFAMAKLPEVLLSWRHRAGRATFTHPRYTLERFRETKAPFLAERVRAAHKRRLVIWGAGPTGRRVARELEPYGLRAQLFIDIDPEKIGRTARQAPIASMDALDVTSDVLVAAVGARGARELIRPELAARGFEEGKDYWFAA